VCKIVVNVVVVTSSCRHRHRQPAALVSHTTTRGERCVRSRPGGSRTDTPRPLLKKFSMYIWFCRCFAQELAVFRALRHLGLVALPSEFACRRCRSACLKSPAATKWVRLSCGTEFPRPLRRCTPASALAHDHAQLCRLLSLDMPRFVVFCSRNGRRHRVVSASLPHHSPSLSALPFSCYFTLLPSSSAVRVRPGRCPHRLLMANIRDRAPPDSRARTGFLLGRYPTTTTTAVDVSIKKVWSGSWRLNEGPGRNTTIRIAC
jgi:hypothetical protein